MTISRPNLLIMEADKSLMFFRKSDGFYFFKKLPNGSLVKNAAN